MKLKCKNVTVEDFRISGWSVGVLGVFNNNTVIANDFTNNDFDVAVYADDYRIVGNRLGAERIVGKHNVISQNHIVVGTFVTGFWITSSSGTVIEAFHYCLCKCWVDSLHQETQPCG
jgi:hypothetical protein